MDRAAPLQNRRIRNRAEGRFGGGRLHSLARLRSAYAFRPAELCPKSLEYQILSRG